MLPHTANIVKLFLQTCKNQDSYLFQNLSSVQFPASECKCVIEILNEKGEICITCLVVVKENQLDVKPGDLVLP